MFDPTMQGQIPPMNASDLFMAQNLGLQQPQQPTPLPMPAAMSMGMPQQTPMGGPQNVQTPEMQHLTDVLQQYTNSKQNQQNNSGLVQQILSNRMQPTLGDASQSTAQTAQSFLAPNLFRPQTPDQAMVERYQNQLAPYTQGLNLANQSAELSGHLMQNNITQQTGLPMAQAQLQAEQMKNQIMQQTGMSSAQADIALKNSQAGYYSSALQRDLAEKAFDYQNNPQNIQARVMGQYLQGMSGQGQPQQAPTPQQNGFGGMSTPVTTAMPQGGQIPPSSPQQQVQTQPQGQPAFNPMGAMLAKQFGLENMQIGANGQPQMIPGVVTPGQKQIDTDFATSLQTYQNAGGAKRTADTIQTVQNVIDALKSGKITTGGILDRNALNNEGAPTWVGRNFDPSVLVARNLISSAILPQAKPLFGARVTNFDAQSLVNSKGIDPMADNATNIMKLQNLISEIKSGQQDLMNGGSYFSQKGTLSGYQPISQQPETSGAVTHVYNPATGQLEPVQ